jgi:hypothetical protein
MYVIRLTLLAKPGSGGALIEKLRAAAPHFASAGMGNPRILTDVVGTTWTILMEFEVESLNTYFEMSDARESQPGLAAAMQGYADLVVSGKREIFKVVSLEG